VRFRGSKEWISSALSPLVGDAGVVVGEIGNDGGIASDAAVAAATAAACWFAADDTDVDPVVERGLPVVSSPPSAFPVPLFVPIAITVRKQALAAIIGATRSTGESRQGEAIVQEARSRLACFDSHDAAGRPAGLAAAGWLRHGRSCWLRRARRKGSAGTLYCAYVIDYRIVHFTLH